MELSFSAYEIANPIASEKDSGHLFRGTISAVHPGPSGLDSPTSGFRLLEVGTSVVFASLSSTVIDDRCFIGLTDVVAIL